MDKSDLRTMVLGIVQKGLYPKKEGGTREIATNDKYGEILINHKGKDGVHFLFGKFNRLFVLGEDGTVVERVAVPTQGTVKPDAPRDPLEALLVEWVKDDNYPDREGESLTMEYEEDQRICLLTRVQKGVVADFLQEDKKLYYDFAKHQVRKYVEPPPSPRREARIVREREKVEKEGVPHEMVEQLGYDGEPEQVDKHHYCNKFVCACGNVRWVANADMFQVKKCKPCTKKRGKK